MSKPQTRNDLESAVPKFCYGLEVHRRTADGRVRTAREFLVHFFPHDKKSSTDRLFRYLPPEVRGPILTTWGVRGRKSALLDDDAKVQAVIHDSLVAGDLDSTMFEDGLAPDTIMRWIDLADWWTFWRGGKITKYTILKALESGYELGLFDADWFLATIRGGGGGQLRGTDVLAEGLNKADLTEWVRRVHESGEGSPKGLLAALGWDQIVAKTTDDVLVAVLDAVALKVSLSAPEPKEPPKGDDKDAKADAKGGGAAKSPAAGATTAGEAKTETPAGPKPEPKPDAAKVEAAKPAAAEAKPEVKADAKAEAKADAKADAKEPVAEAKIESKPENKVDAAAVAADSWKTEPPPKAAALPGVLIPASAVPANKADEMARVQAELDAIDASLGEDSGDELIPISGAWNEDGTGGSEPPPANIEGAKADAGKGQAQGQPAGNKRPTRNPPPPPPTRGSK